MCFPKSWVWVESCLKRERNIYSPNCDLVEIYIFLFLSVVINVP